MKCNFYAIAILREKFKRMVLRREKTVRGWTWGVLNRAVFYGCVLGSGLVRRSESKLDFCSSGNKLNKTWPRCTFFIHYQSKKRGRSFYPEI